MNTHPPTLQVQIKGEANGLDLRPGIMSSRKIAEIITAFEDAITSTILAQSPQLKNEQIIVGLQAIQEGSISLSFSANPDGIILPAVRQITTAVGSNNYFGLTNTARESLRILQNIIKSYNGTATFFELNGSITQLAVLTAESVIPKSQNVKGDTTLYGEITRLGGKEPKIRITDFNGKSISCLAPKWLVLEASKRLYQTVALKGIATWDADTLDLIEFQAEELLPYTEIPLTDFFAGLKEIIGEDFAETDPDEFVYQLRYEM